MSGGDSFDTDVSAGRGDPGDAHAVGDGKAEHTADHPISKEEAEQADTSQEGTPDDLKPGKRRAVGQDEDVSKA